MPSHDIIDNQNEVLLNSVRDLLQDSVSAKFAVGYLFITGLEPIMDKIERLEELRIVMGTVTSKKTIEQLAEAHLDIPTAKQELEAQISMNRSTQRRAVSETKKAVRTNIGLIDQTDDNENVIRLLCELVSAGKIKVRVYVKGRLHSKAYIFDYPSSRYDKGNAIIGSSNLSLGGLSNNTELNAVISGGDNHERLTEWFNDLWDQSEDFKRELLEELGDSWALNMVSPHDIYIKTIYHLVKDRLELKAVEELVWDETMPPLTAFQMEAFKYAIKILKKYGGVIVGDVVGMGKTYIGTAILRELQTKHRSRHLIICPAALKDVWEMFCGEYDIRAEIITIGMLSHGTVDLITDPRYRNIDTVLIDESHNFRYPDTNRYKNLQPYLYGKKVILLTATPRNNTNEDIYHQIKLFHHDEETRIPIEPSNLKKFFKEVENGNKPIQELLRHILIRRTRRHILKYWGESDENGDTFIRVQGVPYYFPQRELKTWTYSIEDTYSGFYDDIMENIQSLTFAKYGLWNYLHDDFKNRKPYSELEQIGKNLRGFMRVLLLKRLESSVFAFKITIGRLLKIHRLFVESVKKGYVPAGEEASELLYDAESYDEEILLENLARLRVKYDLTAFKVDELSADMGNDIRILTEMNNSVNRIDSGEDAKLQKLKELLSHPQMVATKVLIFTQYADTAHYIYDNIKNSDVHVITGKEKNKLGIVRRFAPKSNNYELKEDEDEIRILVSTDVLSEGLNLQDAFTVINYDIHWNPVRLIQRIGRLDRLGALTDTIYVHNFLPEKKLESHLGLKERIQSRIDEIHRTIGEDEQILDKTEQINKEAMYTIYGNVSRGIDDIDVVGDPLSEDLFNLNEAEELIREIKKNEPDYLEYVKNLSDGVRSAKSGTDRVNFVFCHAGDYQTTFLIDKNNNIMNTDIITAINLIKCDKNEKQLKLPAQYNESISNAMEKFRKMVGERKTRQNAIKTLKPQQRYVLNELQRYYEMVESEGVKLGIDRLKEIFGSPLPNVVLQHLNKLKSGGLEDKALFDRLKEICFHYSLHRIKDQKENDISSINIPTTVCSMAILETKDETRL